MLADWFGVPNAEALVLASLFERDGTTEDLARRTGVAADWLSSSVARLRKAGVKIPKANRWQPVYRLGETGRAQVLEAYEFTARLLTDRYTHWADERIATLEAALGLDREVPPYGLTAHEADFWRLLPPGKLVTKERIWLALYGHLSDPPEPKIVDVWLCKVRRKLAAHGVTIRTVWGHGVVLEGANAREPASVE